MSLSPEEKLLLACSHQNFDQNIHVKTDDLSRILSNKDLDWDYLFKTSLAHGLTPLMYHHLESFDSLVPKPIFRMLRCIYEHNRERNQKLYHELSRIISALNNNSIDAIMMKGVRLALDVYRDAVLRPIGDVDVLIHKENFDKTRQILAEIGYLPIGKFDFRLQYGSAFHFVNKKNNIWIDLQWKIVQREWDDSNQGHFRFEVDRMWKDSVSIEGEHIRFKGFSVEDMLFHLCLHLEGHHYHQFILLCDIAETVRIHLNRLNWDALIQRAQKFNVESSLYYPLFFASRLLSAPIPQKIFEKLGHSVFKGSLYSMLYGGLTKLHYLVDEVETYLPMPSDLMESLRGQVREQVEQRLSLYEEVQHKEKQLSVKKNHYLLFSGIRKSGDQSSISHPGIQIVAIQESNSTIEPDSNMHLDYSFPVPNYNSLLKHFIPLIKGKQKTQTGRIEIIALPAEQILLNLIGALKHWPHRYLVVSQISDLLRCHGESVDWNFISQYCYDNGLTEELRIFRILLQYFYPIFSEHLIPLSGNEGPPRVFFQKPAKISNDEPMVPGSLKRLSYTLSGLAYFNGLPTKLGFILKSLFPSETFWQKTTLPIRLLIFPLRILIDVGYTMFVVMPGRKNTTFVYWLNKVKA